jgi:hypothetical protein
MNCRGADDAAPAHEGLRAVVARPHGDPLLIEQRGHVVRVQAVHAERDHRAAWHASPRSVHGHARNGGQLLDGGAGQGALVLGHSLHPELLEIRDRRHEPHGFCDRRSAWLEAPRQIVPPRPIDPDLLDHLAATARGLEGVQHCAPGPQNADARRPEHLVAREDVEVTAQRGHIERKVRRGLSAIDDRHRPGRARPPA